MTSGAEDPAGDGICGWGGGDFDEELLNRDSRRAKADKKHRRKSKQDSSHSSSASTVNNPPAPPPKQRQNVDKPQRRKRRDPQLPVAATKPADPRPRPTALKDGNAAIAALGRERRMKAVAAALAANVPREAGIISVVSASFDGGSASELEDDGPRRHSSASDSMSSPQLHLPNVGEPLTAPAGPIQAPKKIHPPFPLPLLSIKPDCGGNETRLSGKTPPRHRRQHRKKKPVSLLPSRDASDHWETNFPPAAHHSTAKHPHKSCTPPRPWQVKRIRHSPRSTTSIDALPLIHQDKATVNAPVTTTLNYCGDDAEFRDDESTVNDDDDGHTYKYNDLMAGLIQTLSTFADTEKSKLGKGRKRNSKPHPQSDQMHKAPSLPCKPQQAAESETPRQKHRKFRRRIE